MNRVLLLVEGMHCDDCAKRIEGLLEKEPGVREAQVSFAAGSARVSYNPHAVGKERLVEVIEGGGFSVRPGDDASPALPGNDPHGPGRRHSW